MRASDQLSDFVGTALAAGHDRQSIAAELRAAGWSDAEVDTALHAWADTAFLPPVPRPRAIVSAREAFTYGLLFAAMLVVSVSIVWLGFELIERWDSGERRIVFSHLRDIREAIAYLIVFLPVFLLLSRRVETSARADRSLRRSPVRKWFGYVSLLLAILVLLGDLVLAVQALLEGTLDARFLAKAVLVLATVGLVILYVRGVTAEPEDAP